MFEAVSWAIVDPESERALTGSTGTVRLRNPLSEDRAVMRTTLLGGLLDAVAANQARHAERVALYEIGNVFLGIDEQGDSNEPLRLAAVLCGKAEPGWAGRDREVDGHDIVGAVELVAEAIGKPLRVVQDAEVPKHAHPAVSAWLQVGDTRVGWVGGIHPSVQDRWNLTGSVFAFELELGALLESEAREFRYSEVARTPASKRDVALLLDRNVTYDAVRSALDAFNDKYLESVELFDVYEGERLPAGKRSIALSVTYRKSGGSLTDKQVDKSHTRLVGHLEQALGAQQR